jgi:hypothetical protein
MKDLNVYAGTEDGAPMVVTVLEGKTLDPKPPVKIAIVGTIKSVNEFLKKRYRDQADSPESVNNGVVLQKVDPKSAVITVDEDAMTILLELDPEHPYGTTVKGVLEFTKYLDQFHINQPTTHKREELVKILRFSKPLFKDPEKYEDLLKAYQTFDFKAAIDAQVSSDLRANKSAAYSKRISTNLPEDFILRLPIFKGFEPEEFRVEICYDTTDASIKFWFESVELAQLIDKLKIEIFTEQLLPFQDFVIIHK